MSPQTIRRRGLTRGLTLGLLLTLPAALAAPLDRQSLWNSVANAGSVRLAQSQRELAWARLGQLEGVRVTLSGSGTVARVGEAGISSDLLTGLRVTRAGTNADDARLSLQQAAQRAEFEVRRAQRQEWRARVAAWDELAEAWADLNWARSSRESAALQERSVAGRAAQGGATPLQTQAALLELQRADLALAQAQGRLAAARSELLALGLGDAEATPASWQALPRPALSPALLAQRADVFEAQLALAQAEASLEQARRDAQPSLTARGEWNERHWNASASLDRFGNADASLNVRLREQPASGWSLGLHASVPLDGTARRTLQLSERMVELARTSLAEALQRARRDVETRHAALTVAEQNLELAQKSLAAQRQTAAVAQERLDQGLIPVTDLAQANVAVFKAAQLLADAQSAHDTAALQLWEASGQLPPATTPLP